jgi:hypothetical protein
MIELINAAQPVLHGVFTLASVAGVASALAAVLPKKTAPGAYGFVRDVIDSFAFNFGNARNAP